MGWKISIDKRADQQKDLSSLRNEVERLKGVNELAMAGVHGMQMELRKIREALQKFLDHPLDGSNCDFHLSHDPHGWAKEALAEEKEKGESNG